ncbi:MAG: SBBP repeat-containing protein, partial [Spirochaetes bacterium]|nr:SBBP repeat-containing protein [Spirochaetota bacterium]
MKRNFIYIFIIFIILISYSFNCTRYDFLSEDEWNDLFNKNSDNKTSISNSSTSGGYSLSSLSSSSLSSSSSSSLISSSSSSISSSSSSSSEDLFSQILGSNDIDEGISLTTDESGNIFIAGSTQTTLYDTHQGATDIIIVQIKPDGFRGWAIQIGSSSDDYVNDIKYHSGFIYITGVTHGNLFGTNSYKTGNTFIAKYDSSNGQYINSIQFNDIFYNSGNAIEADSTGVYVAGGTEGSLFYSNYGLSDYFIAKYDLSLNPTEIWGDQGGVNTQEIGTDIVIYNNYIYLTGCASTPSNGFDFFFIKYEKDDYLKIYFKQFGGNYDDLSTGITTDEYGFIYITGTTNSDSFITSSLGGNDIFMMKIDPSTYNSVNEFRYGSSQNDISSRIKYRYEDTG